MINTESLIFLPFVTPQCAVFFVSYADEDQMSSQRPTEKSRTVLPTRSKNRGKKEKMYHLSQSWH